MSLGSGGDIPFVSGVVVSSRCHWKSRPQEEGGRREVGLLRLEPRGPKGLFNDRNQMVR